MFVLRPNHLAILLTDMLQVENDRLVSRETEALGLEAREQLGRYRDRYDAYFKSRGNNYDIRDPNALAGLQAAEQDWHDWVVVYLEELYGIGRPDWALQPLPGLQMVRFTRGQGRASGARARAWLPPTPPPSSPVRPRTSAPVRPRKMKLLGVVDISDDEDEQPLRKKTPPPSSPVRPRTSAPVHPPKRKLLGVLDISDDDDDEQPVRKKTKVFIDLTL